MQTKFELQYPLVEILNLDPIDYIVSNSFFYKDIGNFITYTATTKLARCALVETHSDIPEYKVYNAFVHDPDGNKFSEVLYFYNEFTKIIKSLGLIINIDFSKFQNHLLTGTVSGGTTFTCNLELILQDLIKYLNTRQYLQNEDHFSTVSRLEKFHRLVQDLYTDKSILFEPKISTKQNNIIYTKFFNNNIRELLAKANIFLEYCYFLEKHYINRNEIYSDLFKKYTNFFLPLLVDIQKEYILHNTKINNERMELIDDTPVYFVEDTIKKLLISHLVTIFTLDHREALEIVRWKNRLFGKGYKLFRNYEYAINGNETRPKERFDLENFTIEFNKMIKSRLEKNQVFCN